MSNVYANFATEDVSSTRNALRIAAQAEETGRETLARLGAQGEMIHETEKVFKGMNVPLSITS